MTVPFPDRNPPGPASPPDRPLVALFPLNRTAAVRTVHRPAEGVIRRSPSGCVGTSIHAVLPGPVESKTLSGGEHAAREEESVRFGTSHPSYHQCVHGQSAPVSELSSVRFCECAERKQCEQLVHLLGARVLHGMGRSRPDVAIATANTHLLHMVGYNHPMGVERQPLTAFIAEHGAWTRYRDASTETGRVEPVQRWYSRTEDMPLLALSRTTPVRDDINRIQAFDLAVKEHRPLPSTRDTDWMVERAVESTDDAVLVTEAEPLAAPGPSIVYVNSSFTALTGYRQDEALGRTPKILYGPNTDLDVLESLQAHLQEGAPFRGKLVAYKKNGRPYVAEWSVAPIRNADGSITHWMSVQSEVTSNDTTEPTRPPRQSDAESLYAAMDGLLHARTPETVATELVHLTTEILGVSQAVVRQRTNDTLVPLAASDGLDSAESIALAGSHPAAQALRGDRTAAVDAYVHIGLGSHGTLSVTPNKGSVERPFRLLELLASHATTVLDRIAQDAAERTARRRSDALRSASQALLDASTVSDGAQKAFEAVEMLLPATVRLRLLTFGPSDTVARVLATSASSLGNQGRDREWPVGAQLCRLADSDGLTLVDHLTPKTSTTGLEKRLHREGCRSYVAASVASEDRQALLLACADTDGAFSPDHRRLVQELSDLLGSALRRSSTCASEPEPDQRPDSAALKSALLANVHHELRTPLTSIIGFAEVISKKDDNVTSRFADLIARSGRRLQDTFDALLTLSRLEAETLPLDPTPLSATAEVGAVVELFEKRANEAGLTMQYTSPDASVDVVLDPDGLQNILRHLLKNAITFTEPGGTIHVQLDTTDDELVLSIADSGIGMEPSDVPELLSPFRQASTRLDRPHQGAGLGLAVVKQWVEAMCGQLDIDTHVGEGTTVTVHLPRVLSAAR